MLSFIKIIDKNGYLLYNYKQIAVFSGFNKGCDNMGNNFKIAVLDRDTLGEGVNLDILSDMGDVQIYGTTPYDELYLRISDCDVIVVNKTKLNEKTLMGADRLKLICVTATGFDNIDTEYCKNAGIAVCNVKGYSTDSVAQVTAATVLSLSVNLFSYRSFVNSGAYTKSGIPNALNPIFHEISGKTWGIIGYGNIGKKVGEIATALGCKVIYTKNTPDGKSCDIDFLCEKSDIITVHTPLTEKTRALINSERISKMKDGVILVNTARGAVADEAALTEAVKSGKIGGLGVDVFSFEPMSETHPFNEIKDYYNVCLTPHMAWGALEARQRCIDEIAENIRSFKQGGDRNRIV